MPAEPVASPSEEPLNPYAPPRADVHDHWGASGPEMEVIRLAHLDEESCVKSLAIINCIYSLFFGFLCFGLLQSLIGYASGRFGATFYFGPEWIALLIDNGSVVVLGIVAGLGFRNRRKWACSADALLILCLLIDISLKIFIRLNLNDFHFLEFVSESLFWLALITPAFSLLHIRYSVVLESEYQRVVAATPHIKAQAKLPRDLIVIIVVLFVGSLILININFWTQ
jgi:hypothetical protein